MRFIPKFQTPAGALPDWYASKWGWTQSALGGWNKTLDSSSAGTSIRNKYHGNAGDLNTAFSSMQDYLGNKSNVTADIQSYADSEHFNDVDSFIKSYNQDISTLNNYFKGNVNYGQGADSHNRLFKKLYSSRSQAEGAGEQGNLGYQEGLENKAGSTTWLRRGDLYEKEFNDLTDAEKQNRTHQINYNGKTYSVYKNANGTIGLLPGAADEGSQADVAQPEGETPITEQDKLKLQQPITDAQTKLKKSQDRWSDWAPLTMELMNDIGNINYQTEQQKKMLFPLQEAPFLQKKVTNDYHARTALKQNASELRNMVGTQNLTSDINWNVKMRDWAEQQASRLDQKANQLKADTFARTTQEAQEVANKNRIAGVDVANKNRIALSAAWNNFINANMRRSEALNNSKNTYIDSMYKSFGEYKKHSRMNDLLEHKLNVDITAGERSRNLANEFKNKTEDMSTWSQYGAMIDDMLKPGANNEFNWNTNNWNLSGTYAKDWSSLTPAQKEDVKNWLANSNSDEAKKWRTAWNDQLKSYKTDYENQLSQIATEAQKASIPTYLSPNNQWWWRYRKGGKVVDPVAEAARQSLKELQHVRTEARRVQAEANKQTRHRLEQLSKEQLVLLKSVFK